MIAPFQTAGIHHITLVSRDAQRTLDFYTQILGLRLVKQTVNFDDPGAYHLYFGVEEGWPGSILTFFEWKHVPRGMWGIGGIHHVALETRDETTQLKWKRWLNDHGIAVTGPYDRTYFRSIYFQDPDGVIIEIATAGPGFAVDEPVDALGQRLIEAPDTQLIGQRDEDAIKVISWPDAIPSLSPDMRLNGIHHITGITDDLQRSRDFYLAALGMPLIKQTPNRDDPGVIHDYYAPYDGRSAPPAHSTFTLFGWPQSRNRTRGGYGLTHHVAFRAESLSQQEQWRQHLLKMGLQVSPIMDRHYFTSIYFRAPDGLLLEIATDDPGFAIDENASSLGQALKLPPQYEAMRSSLEAELVPLQV